ncbi:hypothetical protein WEI85_19725 [Actinomycetes bacterium KLBMP 9797]
MRFVDVIQEVDADGSVSLMIRTDTIVAFTVYAAEVQIERALLGPKVRTVWFVRLLTAIGWYRSYPHYKSRDEAYLAAVQVLGAEVVQWPGSG